jgi:hypothetical protein
MGTGLAIAVAVFGRGPQTWRKTKSIVGANGEMTIRHREFDSGKVTSSRYRTTPRGPEGWSED